MSLAHDIARSRTMAWRQARCSVPLESAAGPSKQTTLTNTGASKLLRRRSAAFLPSHARAERGSPFTRVHDGYGPRTSSKLDGCGGFRHAAFRMVGARRA